MEQLAEKLSVSRQTIHNYEKGITLPNSKILGGIARALGTSLGELLAEPTELPTFRFRADAVCKKNKQLGTPQFKSMVNANLGDYTFLERICGVSPYTPESTPHRTLRGNELNIADIAEQFRSRMGSGHEPFVNLFASAENIGLKVFRTPIAINGFFGLSAYSPDQGAFILVNTKDCTVERQIFTLAHEMGHLILHRDEYQASLLGEGTGEEEMEREEIANYFASHLLVPRKTLFQQIEPLKFLPLNELVYKLKKHFRVSYQVIIRCLSEIGHLHLTYEDMLRQFRWHFRRNNNRILTKKEEPQPLQSREFAENMRFKQLVLSALEMQEISEHRAAELLGVTMDKLRDYHMKKEIEALVWN